MTNLKFTSLGCFMSVIPADAYLVFCITALKKAFPCGVTPLSVHLIFKGSQDYAGTSLAH